MYWLMEISVYGQSVYCMSVCGVRLRLRLRVRVRVPLRACARARVYVM